MTPKIWLGMGVRAWLRLLGDNDYAVAPRHLPWAAAISLLSIRNSALGVAQSVLWGRRVRRTRITEPPLFVIGHWRSGTTWLHELLSLDERHAFPSTYACIFPSHFLLTERYVPRLLHSPVTVRRPMDDMEMGWRHPQEDEFALCNLGLPTPYHLFAFPNNPAPYPEYLDLQGVSQEALERWKETLIGFVKAITHRTPGRVVLKSPTHTARIEVLLDLFPGARFVHVVRDPHDVIPSTLRAWERLQSAFGLQRPTLEGLEELVFAYFRRLFDALERSRPLVEPSRFHELRYEALVDDPVGQLRMMYEHLELGGFESVLPRIQESLARTADHRPRDHRPSPELVQRIGREARSVIERYGYQSRCVAPRDVAPRDVAPRDVAPRDIAPRDVAPRRGEVDATEGPTGTVPPGEVIS